VDAKIEAKYILKVYAICKRYLASIKMDDKNWAKFSVSYCEC